MPLRHLEGVAEIRLVKWVCSLEEGSRMEVDLCEFSLSQGASDTVGVDDITW